MLKIAEILFYNFNIELCYLLNRLNRQFLQVYRSLDIKKLIDKYPKEKKFLIYVRFYSYLPSPGTPAWLNTRSLIGGSEMSIVLGINPFQNPDELIRRKKNNSFYGNIYTRWGNIFEYLLFQVVAYLCRISDKKLIELGSIPGLKYQNQIIQSYTPDRIGIIDGDNLNILLGGTRKGMQIILFEGKCPIRRIPNGRIPSYYEPQILTGGCTIPIIDECIFVDGAFRWCSLEDLNFNNNYKQNFHGNVYFSKPLALGFIGFYSNSYLFPEKKEIDESNIEKIFEEVVRFSRINVFYSSICFDELKKEEWFMENIEKYNTLKNKIGILSWKLFKIDFVSMKPQKDFLEKNKNKILDFVDKFNKFEESEEFVFD
ncbi:MAG: hypothetical protein QW303_00550 [Nitrososphaerota archaeon]